MHSPSALTKKPRQRRGSTSPRWREWCWLAVLTLLTLSGCDRSRKPKRVAPGVRDVRVLLFETSSRVRVRLDRPYTLTTKSGETLAQGAALSWTPIATNGKLHWPGVSSVEGPAILEARGYGAIHLARERDGAYLPSRQYAGALLLAPAPRGGLRVINRVNVEAYVAGVVPNEVDPSFHAEALKGQAIAARTYVLYLMAQRANKPFDVRASEGDQVYRGIASNALGQRVAAAVDATRGLMLTWKSPAGDRAFCAYYSAACGGESQSIAELQPGVAPTPLRGGVRCDYCRIAPPGVYRWGPAEVAKSALLSALRKRDPSFTAWKTLTSVTVTRTTPGGRIAEVLLHGAGKQNAKLSGERFRLAVGSRTMRSTDCTLVDDGAKLRFENGKGFGHGVGLCQWGMEGQARQGRRAGQILRYYYPGSTLRRAY